MQFADPALQRGYEHVAALLARLFGESARPDDRGPVFWLNYGSTQVGIGVETLPEDRLYVRVYSWVVTGARVDGELTQFLLRANRSMRLGAFGIDDVGDIEFAYGLADHELTPTALRAAVAAVMQTADDYDDAIAERWGGQRAVDRLRAAAQVPADFDRALEEAGLRIPPTDGVDGP